LVVNGTSKTTGQSTLVVNDGTAQHSLVPSLTITFNSTAPLSFLGGSSSSDASAALILTDTITGKVISPSLLTFAPGTDPNTGADGRSSLKVVTANTLLGPAHPSATDQIDNFFLSYGDAQGLGSVSSKGSFDPAFLSYLDYEGNSFLDSAELAQFLARSGTHI
jgi:hypothetical protein